MSEGVDIKVYQANKMLQAKVGTGPVEQEKIQVCQEKLDENTTDFAPMAAGFLKELREAIDTAQSGDEDLESLRQNVTKPVMHLKANASMFGYTLIGDLANIMLNFLESVRALDKDIIAIIDAHHATLSAIVSKKLSGDGGETGKAMKQELLAACKRYAEKRMSG